MLLLAAVGCASMKEPAKPAPILSPATTMQQAGMVDIRSLVPDMSQDIRYFGHDNFVGAPVDGYEAPRCYLKREGRAHSLWCNPRTGSTEAIPRHAEVPNRLARKICAGLGVPAVGAREP